MSEEDREEMDVPDTWSALQNLDENDKKVKNAVLAYYWWHSGMGLDHVKYDTAEKRALRVDALGAAAISRSKFKEDIESDPARVLATKSLYTQSSESRKRMRNTIVGNLDLQMIQSGDFLPKFDIDGDIVNFNLQSELQEVGYDLKNYSNLRDRYEKFGRYLETDPATVMMMLEHLEESFFSRVDPLHEARAETTHKIRPEWNIVGASDNCDRTFPELNLAYNMGKVVRITGQVLEVGQVLTDFVKVAFRCISFIGDTNKRCMSLVLVDQNKEEGVLVKPTKCERCQGKDFKKEKSEKSIIEQVQRLRIQESTVSEDPHSHTVELRGNLAGGARAGSTIAVTGIVSLEQLQKGSLKCLPYLLAKSVKSVSDVEHSTMITDEQAEEVVNLCDSMPLADRIDYLIEQWCGDIEVDPLLKRALFLQAIGAPAPPSQKQRSAIHILIVGDPGTAKTLLLNSMRRLSKGSRGVSAESATQAGLVAAAQQVEDLDTNKKRWALMPGALALTPRESVCCVDELNLYKGDFGDFNNALESGKVEVTKVVKGTIETACSVLAGANPIAGNKKQFVNGTSYFLQLGFDYTTAQRFDGIYVLRDEANMVRDESISSKIIAASREEPADLSTIHNYIAYAKLIDPVLSDEAGEYISKRHALKRRDSSGSDYMRSHRQVPSLIRFALATARFDLNEVATLNHVKFAEKILEITLNERDPGIMAGAAPAADRDHRKKVAKIVVEYAYAVNAESISTSSVQEYAKEKHKLEITDKELRSIIVSFVANPETGLNKNKDGTFSYDGAQNPAYDMW